ncbi:MAG: L-2-amino-thiazoline-4-carboxylic acid hydrolase [Candidatus Heimdallarchaeota archaeon]|nr:L-2-amino-thiazoline-4-carboxylic acid hydrolase [Candidatus Heimdallarchaeota archaeon]
MVSEKKKMGELLNLRRRLEAYHLDEKVAIIQALKEKYGSVIISDVETVRSKRVREMWKKIAEKLDNNTIDDLIDALWNNEYFEYSVTKEQGNVQLNVTRCMFFEIAKELGVTEMAFNFFCVDDPYIVEGFNSEIGFSRTKTLMQGDGYCNHCYWMKKS